MDESRILVDFDRAVECRSVNSGENRLVGLDPGNEIEMGNRVAQKGIR